jgi:hypothetical protein
MASTYKQIEQQFYLNLAAHYHIWILICELGACFPVQAARKAVRGSRHPHSSQEPQQNLGGRYPTMLHSAILDEIQLPRPFFSIFFSSSFNFNIHSNINTQKTYDYTKNSSNHSSCITLVVATIMSPLQITTSQ